MKRIIASLAVAGLSVGFGAAASAADLGTRPEPVYTKAPMMAPALSWTGFYIGGNAGYGWGDSETTGTLDPNSAFGNAAPVAQPAYNANMSPGLKPKGFAGGATVGANWQMGMLVLGAEGDFGAFHLSDTANTSVTPTGHVNLSSATTVNTDWLATARARVGWAFDRSLLYATGGLAATDLKFHQVNTYAGLGPTGVEDISLSSTKTGWTVGAGWEYMLNRNWTVKAEYLYMDFGSISGTGTVPIQPVTVAHTADLVANVVRGGVNFKFGP
jgi:outer membrane immunogenic protein